MSTAKPSASTLKSVKASILADLRQAYPRGRSTIDLIHDHGTCAKSRLNELKSDGWQIGTGDVDGAPGYFLLSLAKGKATKTLAGCVLKLTDAADEPWSQRTQVEAIEGGVVPEEVLLEAERAAAGAYLAVLRRRGLGHLLPGGAVPAAPQAPKGPVLDIFGDDGEEGAAPPARPAKAKAVLVAKPAIPVADLEDLFDSLD